MGPYKTELVARRYTVRRSSLTQEPMTPADVCDLLDALMEFAEAKGVSRYPEATFLHRIRAAAQP